MTHVLIGSGFAHCDFRQGQRRNYDQKSAYKVFAVLFHISGKDSHSVQKQKKYEYVHYVVPFIN